MIKALRAQTARPFNVNVFCHRPAIARPDVEKTWIERLRPEFARFDSSPHRRYAKFIAASSKTTRCSPCLIDEKPHVVSFHFGLAVAGARTRVARRGHRPVRIGDQLAGSANACRCGRAGYRCARIRGRWTSRHIRFRCARRSIEHGRVDAIAGAQSRRSRRRHRRHHGRRRNRCDDQARRIGSAAGNSLYRLRRIASGCRISRGAFQRSSASHHDDAGDFRTSRALSGESFHGDRRTYFKRRNPRLSDRLRCRQSVARGGEGERRVRFRRAMGRIRAHRWRVVCRQPISSHTLVDEMKRASL